MTDPVLKPVGDSLFVVWPERAVFEFSRLSERSESLSAEAMVCNALGTELHWARVNLSSTQGRGTLTKALEEADPQGDWRGLVDRSCRMVALHVRTGTAAEPLIAAPLTMDQRWAIEGLVPLGQITVLFGDGGSLKSYLALATGIAGLLDRPITARWRMVPLQKVMYLDWEADRKEQAWRLGRLTSGLGSCPVDGAILHRTMRRPLRDEITAIRSEAARAQVDLVIADSLAPASGMEPEHADAALGALLALRSLEVTVLCIAHVSKVQADSKAPARPYGSVHIQNLARSTIEARGSESDDADESTISLYHRKSNQGRKCPPLAIKFTYEPGGGIRVGSGEPDSGGASLSYQILDALRGGARDSGQLAEELEANPATVKKALQRLETRDKVIRLGDSKTSRLEKQQWGRKDVTRDTTRDTEEQTVPSQGEDDAVPF